MKHIENGSLLIVLSVAAGFHGVVGLAASALWMWFWTIVGPVRSAEGDCPTADSLIARRYRRQIFGLAAVANLTLAMINVALILKLGTFHRATDGFKVNWSYFAIGEAVAYCCLAVMFTIFCWIHSTGYRVLLAVAWVLWCVLLGLGTIPHFFEQRLYFFIAAVVVQFLSGVFLFLASSDPIHGVFGSMLFNWRGFVPNMMVMVCIALADAYWYVGYLNRGHPGPHDNVRWHAHLAFFLAAFVAHVLVPAWLAWFYDNKEEDVSSEIDNAAIYTHPHIAHKHAHSHLHLHSHVDEGEEAHATDL